MKARNFLVVLCIEKKKTEDSEDVFFRALPKNFLLTWKSYCWPTFYQMDFMKRYVHTICSICYITKGRLDVQIVEKLPLEMVISQQMKEEIYNQNNGFCIKLSIHCYLSRICN